jgi:hypothetical protein
MIEHFTGHDAHREILYLCSRMIRRKHSSSVCLSAPLWEGARVGYGVPGFPCVFFQRMIWDDGELGPPNGGEVILC